MTNQPLEAAPKYNATIQNGYALITRTQSNGYGGTEEQVVRTFKGKHYANDKNAIRAMERHAAKYLAG
tara:strand:+ start:286 stop:489 length:204 start_codon:yes stop_codon:yes gene_type:complete